MTVGTELEPLLKSALEQIRANKAVKLSDLLDTLVEAKRPPLPAKIALPVKITDKQKAALDRLPEVFGKVVPSERRLLEPVEVDTLLEEREVLKEIEAMVTARKTDGIRLIVLNHHDVNVEATVPEAERAELWRDDDGHYIHKDKVPGSPGNTQVFSVEPRAGSLTVSLEKLQEQVADGDVEFDHADFLAMTTPVRVFDENKAMLLLKKKPHLIAVLRDAAVKGKPSVAVQPRKA